MWHNGLWVSWRWSQLIVPSVTKQSDNLTISWPLLQHVPIIRIQGGWREIIPKKRGRPWMLWHSLTLTTIPNTNLSRSVWTDHLEEIELKTSIFHTQARFTNCGDYFVYFLEEAPAWDFGYCTVDWLRAKCPQQCDLLSFMIVQFQDLKTWFTIGLVNNYQATEVTLENVQSLKLWNSQIIQ